jgi:hypothetical protein
MQTQSRQQPQLRRNHPTDKHHSQKPEIVETPRVYMLAVQVASLTATQLAEFRKHLAVLWGDESGGDLLGVREPNPLPEGPLHVTRAEEPTE